MEYIKATNKRAQMTAIAIVVAVFIILGLTAYFVTRPNADETNGNGNGGIIVVPDTPLPISPTPTPTTPAQPQTYELNIADFAYSQLSLTIKSGDVVVWTNKDSTRHTVTSDSGSELNSALLSQGQTYSHTFNSKGTFSYHCTPHPNMKGKIIVE